MTSDVLVVENNRIDGWFLASHLSSVGLRAAATDVPGFIEQMEHADAHLVLLALGFFSTATPQLLRRLGQVAQRAPVVLLAYEDDVPDTRIARRLGAKDVLFKPFSVEEIDATLKLYLRTPARRAPPNREPDKTDHFGFHRVIGNSPAFQRVVAIARKIALSDSATVLIQGESGTGKDVLAKAIHFESQRYRRPFVEITSTALPETLLESELFGHERGAFTDAKSRRQGLIPSADGGTVFLNEIGDMSLSLQAKILRVIEQRTCRPVGASEDLMVDVRIIAATCVDLEQAVADGRFRADLYYRLNVIPLHMPPLRERGEDVLALAEHFTDEYSERFERRIDGFSDRFMDYLQRHNWPGNVRELRNLIERAMILGEGPELDVDFMAIEEQPPAVAAEVPGTRAPRTSDTPHAPNEDESALPEDGVRLKDLEEWAIRHTLARCDHNISEAARRLDIGRDALRYRLRKFGIDSKCDAPTGTEPDCP